MIDTAKVEGLEQGRVFSGREALSHRMIDQLGGELEVVKYLEDQRGVPKGLKIVDWEVTRDGDWRLVRLAISTIARATGISALDQLAQAVNEDRLASLRLDGLLSIWHGTER
jgi:protease-4